MFTAFVCPNCGRQIESHNINITTDLAKCEACGAITKASTLVAAHEENKLPSSTPPVGSVIELTKEMDGSIQLFLPRKGLRASHLPLLGFSIFWLAFIAFWTWGASRGSAFFAMFSIPFWIVGLVMLISTINSMLETQIIQINRSQLTLIKERPVLTKRYTYNLADIQEIKTANMKENAFTGINPGQAWRSQRSIAAATSTPAIFSGRGTHYFFEWANETEQQWAIGFLNHKLKQLGK